MSYEDHQIAAQAREELRDAEADSRNSEVQERAQLERDLAVELGMPGEATTGELLRTALAKLRGYRAEKRPGFDGDPAL